jgi:glycerophosphoryl diester phosphodiesterase
MKKYVFVVILFYAFQLSAQVALGVQGHRGARGLFPENSIYGFIEAAKLGVNTLEMDVVVSADNQLVVSHEPWFNSSICQIDSGMATAKNIYLMSYAEISQIDCGSKGHPKFGDQQKIVTTKPLLMDVIDTIEKLISLGQINNVQYSIEIKSTEAGDNVQHPTPPIFAQLLYDVLKLKNVLHKATVQSFDVRALQSIREIDDKVKLAYLVFNLNSLKTNLRILGFKPAILSPNYMVVKKQLTKKCHANGVKIIPWTVNDEQSIKKLIKQGVDGIISDYPNLVIKCLK